MALAASGVLATILERAVKTLAQCASWQDWTGHPGDETAAGAHISEYEETWEEPEVLLGRDVRCLVGLENARPVRGGPIWSATVFYRFEAPVGAAYADDPGLARREFQNRLGAVVEELRADSQADTSGLLLDLRCKGMVVGPPLRTPESQAATDDDVIWADVRVPAGPGD